MVAVGTPAVCVLLLLAAAGSVVSGFTPVTYPATVSSECDQYDPLQDQQQLTEALSQAVDCILPNTRSCQKILHCSPSAPSGYYKITAPNGSPEQVYCDMEGTNCGGEGGWTRVAYVNMSQSGATCPQGLTQRNFLELTLCGNLGLGCRSTAFSTLGLSYSQVCGQLRGYQFYAPDAFGNYNAYARTIDEVYVDGVSITYGSAPRKHIWTYANGDFLGNGVASCPCNNGSSAIIAPPFVGSDYYCETGNNVNVWTNTNILYSNDTLWDGQQCPGVEAPCCTQPNMPWFNKTLSETTTEDIELRVCRGVEEDTPLELIELFVH